MLRAEHLKAGHLPPLSFTVPNGECLSVEGPSGAGKTRLLRALADLDPSPGYVYLDGQERREMPATRWRRLVRYAMAEPQWWTETARGAWPDDVQTHARAGRLSAALGLSLAHLDAPLAQLSTGERLRLALVRALIDEPRVLLLDEPTASLDTGNAALVEEMIRFQLLSGRSVILVSHDAGLLRRLAHARLQLAEPTRARDGRAA